MTDVVLIAPGYEWGCPECEKIEYEPRVPAQGRVLCSSCGGSFAIVKAHHRGPEGQLNPGQEMTHQRSLALEIRGTNESRT